MIDILAEMIDILAEMIDILTEIIDILAEMIDILAEMIDILAPEIRYGRARSSETNRLMSLAQKLDKIEVDFNKRIVCARVWLSQCCSFSGQILYRLCTI